MYSVVSNKVTEQLGGVGTLVNGEAKITLDADFAQIMSSRNPVSITVTPMGECNGVYVQRTTDGFIVKELGHGTSNVDFSYFVIASRLGYETTQAANDVTPLLNSIKGKTGAVKSECSDNTFKSSTTKRTIPNSNGNN
jgi:hypothetical protein